jgi:hypothetical protein
VGLIIKFNQRTSYSINYQIYNKNLTHSQLTNAHKVKKLELIQLIASCNEVGLSLHLMLRFLR